MNAEYGLRLSSWRKEQKLSQRALGSVLGVSQGYISDIESGRSEPSRNFLQALTERFGVSADWILYGVGLPQTERSGGFEARKPGKRIEPPDLGRPLSGDFRFADEDFFLIERMDLDVSAGHGIVPIPGAETERIALPRSMFLRSRLTPDFTVLVRVKGDSMAPTIPDGALILLDCSVRRVDRAGIFAFSLDGQSYVKRLVPSGTMADGRPQMLMLVSDNPAFPPVALAGPEMDRLLIAGRVRASIGQFD
ncbi:XRE family transcriptional regulator [Rhodobacter capsulatus]|uniref:Transcriptional regulator, XRE family n=1 Tax=Rhodobacter capsulatus (strain ATCC BAA-309 / NBRC 16581 / SB1003) TaxID=272942 RepID=D5APT6_RHOCB|nr:XRE family transcriptional regulator [Rhodobacter capsulatus]ADE86655.1 transcriptional regulator, XRE family [Rhodobacter capsulatus SB 1003]ETD00242.1 repressor protein [Rhodobacter capsulatus DE442]ETD74581.1 repressor protein [Rhodobacter capsulatus R121]ETE52445.1 repressor protein [Rhodobacter capsulatus Y262]MDS0928455.1 XRE family transcriptional regulator [Rhodobacter capsulatus]